MSEQIPRDGIEAPASFKDAYAINTKLVRAVETALEDGRAADLRGLLEPLRPADFADFQKTRQSTMATNRQSGSPRPPVHFAAP